MFGNSPVHTHGKNPMNNWTKYLAVMAALALLACGEAAGPELSRVDGAQHGGRVGKADDARGALAGRRTPPRVEIEILGLETLTPAEREAFRTDTDGDGLADLFEIYAGTDPETPDSDFDGLGDREELYVHGTNPGKADSDGDGLLDPEELELGTWPDRADSDGDGFDDADEVAAGTGALDADDWPAPAEVGEDTLPRITGRTVRRLRKAVQRGVDTPSLDVNHDGVVDADDVELAEFLRRRRNRRQLARPERGEELDVVEIELDHDGHTLDPCMLAPDISPLVFRFLDQPRFENDEAPEWAIRALLRISTRAFNAAGCDIDGDGVPDLRVDLDGDGQAEGFDVDGDGRIDLFERPPVARPDVAAGDEDDADEADEDEDDGLIGRACDREDPSCCHGDDCDQDGAGDDDEEQEEEEPCCYEPICTWAGAHVDVPSASDTGTIVDDWVNSDQKRRKYEYGPTHLLYSNRYSGNCLASATGGEMSMASSGSCYMKVNMRCARPRNTECERPCRECTARGAGYGNYHSSVEVHAWEGVTCWPFATNRNNVAAADAAEILTCGNSRGDNENLASGDSVTISRSLTVGAEIGKDKDGVSLGGSAQFSIGESRVVGTGTHKADVRVANEGECFPAVSVVNSGGRIINSSDNRAGGYGWVRTEYRGNAIWARSNCIGTDYNDWHTNGWSPADGEALLNAWKATLP